MQPKIVSQEEWRKARVAHLAAEKEFSRQRDELTRQRQQLPWVKLETKYVFDGPDGKRSLGDLFEGRSQLMIYHFMFDPSWEVGCKSCSYVADNLSGALVHLAARDTSFAAISLAPITKIEAFQKRMGWSFPWLSSGANEFNHDFHVTIDEEHPEYNYKTNYFSLAREQQRGPMRGEAPGLSVFVRDGENIYHSYSTYTRGLDIFLNTYNLLDHTPLGRHEDGKNMAWLRHHDKYEAVA